MPEGSYRDASEVTEARRQAALERARAQRRELTADDLARLPPALREELVRIDARLEPADATTDAVLQAEDALAEHERLLASARVVLRQLDKDERRLRHDRALEKVRRSLRRRPVKRALAGSALVITALGVPSYWVFRSSFDETCRRSIQCRERGQCGSNWILTCAPRSEQDCAKSTGCGEFGSCSNVDGYCQAARDADCQRSEACTEGGRCTAVDGSCESE